MNANNINKQQKPIAREDKILKRKQNKPVTLLEITRMRIMYAPVSRIFYEWSPCCKMWNEACEQYRLFGMTIVRVVLARRPDSQLPLIDISLVQKINSQLCDL
jgi:hypothetical protein